MTKTFNIHALPQGKVGFEKGNLCKRITESKVFDEKVGHLMIATTTKTFPNPNWQAQYLYITDVEKHTSYGDWIIQKGELIQVHDNIGFGHNKIILSTNPSLGLPSIPQSLVKAYADANGEMKCVNLQMEGCRCGESKRLNCVYKHGDICELDLQPKIIDNCCIVVENERDILPVWVEPTEQEVNDENYSKALKEVERLEREGKVHDNRQPDQPLPIQVEPEEQVGDDIRVLMEQFNGYDEYDDYKEANACHEGYKLGIIAGAKWREEHSKLSELSEKEKRNHPVRQTFVSAAEKIAFDSGYKSCVQEHSKDTDAVDFAEWVIDNVNHNYLPDGITDTPMIWTVGTQDKTTQDLYQLFKSKQK